MYSHIYYDVLMQFITSTVKIRFLLDDMASTYILFILETIIMLSIVYLIPSRYGSGISSKICSFGYKILFSSFIPPFLRKCEKSPSPVGEGLYLQLNHLYTTYRSVVNFLCTNMLTSTKWKVNRTIH